MNEKFINEKFTTCVALYSVLQTVRRHQAQVVLASRPPNRLADRLVELPLYTPAELCCAFECCALAGTSEYD